MWGAAPPRWLKPLSHDRWVGHKLKDRTLHFCRVLCPMRTVSNYCSLNGVMTTGWWWQNAVFKNRVRKMFYTEEHSISLYFLFLKGLLIFIWVADLQREGLPGAASWSPHMGARTKPIGLSCVAFQGQCQGPGSKVERLGLEPVHLGSALASLCYWLESLVKVHCCAS